MDVLKRKVVVHGGDKVTAEEVNRVKTHVKVPVYKP